MGGSDWARALAAGALPGAAAFALAAGSTMPWWPLVLVPLSAWIARPRPGAGRGPWWLAIALATSSVFAAEQARGLLDAAFGRDRWPTYDLATTAMPTAPPPYVAVTGFLRDGWVLGEYAVADGDVPDQSKPAEAVLVPMTATLDAAVRLEGALVVARVRADAVRTRDRVTLYGRTDPLPRELAVTLVDLVGASSDGVAGVVVDTLRVPTPREAWTAGALALGLFVGAAIAFGVGRRTRTGA